MLNILDEIANYTDKIDDQLTFSYGPVKITIDKQGNIDVSGYKSLTLDGEELDILNEENVYINGKEIHLNMPIGKDNASST